MGQFRIEMNQDGVVAVDFRLPGEHSRFVVEPEVAAEAAMTSLEEHFARTLGYELNEGERNLILQAIALVENVRGETKSRKELKARLTGEAEEKALAAKAAFDERVALAALDIVEKMRSLAPLPSENDPI